jgi:hypothetical protein
VPTATSSAPRTARCTKELAARSMAGVEKHPLTVELVASLVAITSPLHLLRLPPLLLPKPGMTVDVERSLVVHRATPRAHSVVAAPSTDTVVQPTLTALPQRDAKTDARMERQPPESNPQRKIPHQQSAALLPPRLLANPFLVSPRRLPTRSPTQPVSLPPMAAVEPNSETLSVVTGPKETAAACTDTVVKQLLTAVRVASQETAPARLPSLPLPPAQLLLLRSRVALRWLADLVSPVCTLV